MSQSEGVEELILEIAGLRVGLRLPANSPVRELKATLGHFASRESPECWVDVRVTRDPPTGPFEPALPEVTRSGVGLRVVGSGFEALVPTGGGEGWTRQGPDRFPIDSVLKVFLAARLFECGGLLLHGVALAHEGRALVFVGDSGAGKSTLGELGARAGMVRLSDELCAVVPDAGGWRVHGTPWNIGRREFARLAGIGVLAHTPTHALEPLAQVEVIRALLPNAMLPYESAAARTGLFRLASTLLSEVPTFRLSFAKDQGVADVLRRELSRTQ